MIRSESSTTTPPPDELELEELLELDELLEELEELEDELLELDDELDEELLEEELLDEVELLEITIPLLELLEEELELELLDEELVLLDEITLPDELEDELDEELLELPGKIAPPQAARAADIKPTTVRRNDNALTLLNLVTDIAMTPKIMNFGHSQRIRTNRHIDRKNVARRCSLKGNGTSGMASYCYAGSSTTDVASPFNSHTF